MALFCDPGSLPREPGVEQLPDQGKRRLDDIVDEGLSKRAKLLGPFIVDESDEEEQNTSWLGILESKANCSTKIPGVTASYTGCQSTASLIPNLDTISTTTLGRQNEHFIIRKCSGAPVFFKKRNSSTLLSYEQLIASRSVTAPGRATKSYYGIDIHQLLKEAEIYRASRSSVSTLNVHQSVEVTSDLKQSGKATHTLWTEKYRARRFKDLIGDDRTHRAVLRWLKGWDSIVFPGLAKANRRNTKDSEHEDPMHRKILLLTGPPGLGKTTLAHVCAKQAGYEVMEINASDERNRDVVKGRIKDAVGTENVKGITVETDGKKTRQPGKPVCVIVDEVDGVVGGSGSGEGGFMKALVDLVALDQKNSAKKFKITDTNSSNKKRRGNCFRLLRPLILICNDVYHPSLRPLRTSSAAEIIHVRQVPLEQVVQRMRHVFEKEGILCDGDAARRICEASWGLSAKRDRQMKSRGINEGDIRSVLVAGEWIARKLRYSGSLSTNIRLTRKWVEQHIIRESSKDGSIPGLGRGGNKEIIERVFIEGAGFSYDHVGADSFKDPYSEDSNTLPVGVADLRKRHAICRLREMVDAAGEYDRCVTDCFLTYPTQTYQDDTLLSKPNAAYEWLYFHDLASSKIYANQAWELNPYLSQSIIGFHHLFSSLNNKSHAVTRKSDDDEEEHPFSGTRADFSAFEAEKQTRAILTELRSSLSAPLLRIFLSPAIITTELIPNLTRMLSPDIKPVVVGGSGSERGIASVRKENERALVQSAVRVMNGLGVTFEKTRVEIDSGAHGGWIYRMEPALDSLTTFSKTKGTCLATAGSSAPVRYAVRQVLDQEYRKGLLKSQAETHHTQHSTLTFSGKTSKHQADTSQGPATGIIGLSDPKRDFFGRIRESTAEQHPTSNQVKRGQNNKQDEQETKVWVSFHEGFSNAVRKRITMQELLFGL
ncbi:Chromosome transmission fidelity protein 18 [Ophidiomyces ophidiicola]|nr:Chromosome transmission fidelity protein 18 [Ophidiomyces ophidiicola]